MIAIGIIRGATAKIYGSGDNPWSLFWVEVEACVSVMMVSMTAFRTLFVSGCSKKSPMAGSPKQDIDPSIGGGGARSYWRKVEKSNDLSSSSCGTYVTGTSLMISENGPTTPVSLDELRTANDNKKHSSDRDYLVLDDHENHQKCSETFV